MIDRPARQHLAESMRQMLAGTIDNLEFDYRELEESEDAGVQEIWYGVWLCYDDFTSHTLRMTDGQILDCKRCIIFLHSDLEYEWPESEPDLVKRAVRMIGEILKKAGDVSKDSGQDLDYSVWPFARRSDFEEACCSPKLLAGIEVKQ